MDTTEYLLRTFQDQAELTLGLMNSSFLPICVPLMDRDRLSAIFHGLGFTSGAEIGVEEGVFSESLLKDNPGCKLYAVDAWKTYRAYRDHTRQEKLDRFYENTKTRLAPYNVDIVRKFSIDAVKDFPDRSLDFVYIDGNHDFYHCTTDICLWSKKVKVGGIIAGHDYVRFKHKKSTTCHVVDVVNAYTHAMDIRPWFVLGAQDRTYLWVNP
jgi:hypothetical protein